MSCCDFIHTCLISGSRNDHSNNIITDVFYLLMKFKNFSLIHWSLPILALNSHPVPNTNPNELIVHVNFIAITGRHLESCST